MRSSDVEGWHTAPLADLDKKARKLGLEGHDEALRWLAALRQSDEESRAWAASVIYASGLPPRSPRRRAFCHELLEVAETVDANAYRFVNLLLGPKRAEFFELVRARVSDVAALIDDAAWLPGFDPIAVGDDDVAEMARKVNNVDCAPLAAPLARLLATARWRALTFPPSARIRGVLAVREAGEVVTLAARTVPGDGGAYLAFPTCDDEAVAAAFQAAWEHACMPGRRVELRLLDYEEPFRGPSLGLAALIACRNLHDGGHSPVHLAAIGGDRSTPFFPSDELDRKLPALLDWRAFHGRGIDKLVLGATDHAPSCAWSATEVIPATDLDQLRHLLMEHPSVLESCRVKWTKDARAAGRRPVRRQRAEWTLQAMLLTQRLILVTGEPNVGKTTFARDLLLRWNESPGAGRVAFYTDLEGRPELRTAARALAGELQIEHRPDDDLRGLLSAIVQRWGRLTRTQQLVWIVDGIDAALDALAVGALVDDLQRAQVRERPGSFCLIGIVAGGAGWLDARVPRSIKRVELDLFDDAELRELGPVSGAQRELLRHPWAWNAGLAGGWDDEARLRRSPLELVQEMIDARLDQAYLLPKAARQLTAGLAAMAERAELSFASEPAGAATLVARGFVVASADDRVRFREGWLIEHALGAELTKHPVLDPVWVSAWLGKLRAAPASDQPILENALVMALVRIGVRRPHPGDGDRLSALLEDDDPHVVVAAARAALACRRWSSTAARSADDGDVWAAVLRTFRRLPEEARPVLLQLGFLPGAEALISEAIVDGADRVHHAACAVLQGRVRSAAVEADAAGSAERALAPLNTAARSGRRAASIVTAAMVAFAEAGRTGRAAFLDACGPPIREALDVAKRGSRLVRFARSSVARWFLFGAMPAMARYWLRRARSHNPMRHYSEITRHFGVPVAERQRLLGPFIAFMRRPPDDSTPARDALADLEAMTRAIHEVPALAHAPAIWATETAWGTLPPPAVAADLDERVAALVRLFEADLVHADRHAYAQSCLFILFRQLWSSPESLRDAAFKSLFVYEDLLARWIEKTEGGSYKTAAGNEMRILHLFRQAGLSRRLRGTCGTTFERTVAAYPELADALVEEILHLAYEFEEWPLAMEMLDGLERSRNQDRVSDAIRRAQQEIRARRPDVASSRAVAFLGLDRDRTAGAPPSTEPPPLPPMTGMSLAFEEMSYVLLRSSTRFRERWAEWMAGAADGTSSARWVSSVVGLAYDLVFADG